MSSTATSSSSAAARPPLPWLYTPSLSVIGGGSEQAAIAQRVRELGLGDQVRRPGVLRGTAVGDVLRRHHVIVVPSRPEPAKALGLVAIEAIACGCVVVASRQGGLPEAAGGCGLLVPPKDPHCPCRSDALDPGRCIASCAAARKSAEHVRPVRPDAVLDSYEAALAP